MPSDHARDAQIIAEADKGVRSVQTRALDISFNEILDMYLSKELVIDPAYQRLFRWSEAKQSRFIESLVLEMPIPPLYMIEVEQNVYELIDGLQRISTWLHFRGKHPDRLNNDKSPAQLELAECDIVKGLNGLTFDQLPNAVQIKLKRNFIRVEVIRRESDARLRYHMFKRLNTGGAPLSPQEVRNCTIRLLSPKFNDLLGILAATEHFQVCTEHVRGDRKKEMYREELVLRFLALKNDRDSYTHLVDEFLTDYMEKVSDPEGDLPFDFDVEESVFLKTFEILYAIGKETVFSGPNTKFAVNIYEAWALGMAAHVRSVDPNNSAQISRIRQALDKLRGTEEFRRVAVGGGQNYASPLRTRTQLATGVIGKAL